MPLGELIERIRRETEAETASIRETAAREAAEIAAGACAREESLLARELGQLRAQLEFETRRRVSAREGELKRERLDEREILLGDVRARLEKRLAALKPAEEREMLAGLLRKAAGLIPAGTLAMPAHTEAALAQLPAGYAAAPGDELPGGFVLTAKDGDKVLDCAYDTLAKDFWNRRRVEIARALLGDGDAQA